MRLLSVVSTWETPGSGKTGNTVCSLCDSPAQKTVCLVCGGTPSNPVWGPSGDVTFPPVFILAKRIFSSLFYFKQDISLVLWKVCSVAKSCPTLCNLMDCTTPGFPVLHYLSEFALREEETMLHLRHSEYWMSWGHQEKTGIIDKSSVLTSSREDWECW